MIKVRYLPGNMDRSEKKLLRILKAMIRSACRDSTKGRTLALQVDPIRT